MTPRANPSVNRTARKLRLRVPSALRAPAAGYLKRYAALTHLDGPPSDRSRKEASTDGINNR